MIVTAKNRIPFLWQLGIATPWAVLRFKYMVIGSIFIFSLKKFIENPAGITFIMSIPYVLSMFVNPIASFMSDRIWTRYGRRKPFVVTSMIGVALSFIAMPLVPNIWMLMLVYFLYQVSHDFGLGATDTIKQEIVPPKQRGTAAALGSWLQNIANISFHLCALGRFDDYQYYAGFPVTGEQGIYWGIGTAILMMSLLIMLGVKETFQPSKWRGQRFTLRNFFGGLLNRHLWPVYFLITGWTVAHAGLGSLGALLYIEQWGFTKQEMGINVAVGSTLNILLIALIGLFADRLPRMRTFKILMLLSIFVEISFYVYVEFVLFDKTPTLPEVILFGELGAVIGILLGMIYNPMVYDYIPRNEMGTFSAGSVLIGKLVQVITLNGVGLFIAGYAALFMPPGGEMARFTLAHAASAAEVRRAIDASDPALARDERLNIEVWYATNAQWDTGRGTEIRLHNKDSVALKKQRDSLNDQVNSLLAKKSNAEGKAERATLAGRTDTAARAEAETYQTRIVPLRAQIADIDARLKERSLAFAAQLETALRDHLLVPGSQIVAASTRPVALYAYALNFRPEREQVEKLLNDLRTHREDLLDLRVEHRGDTRFVVEISLLGEKTPGQARGLTADLARFGARRLPDELTAPVAIVSESAAEAVALDLEILEDPVNNHLSPVTRVVYSIMDKFGDAPSPSRRLWATARSLRVQKLSRHVGAYDLSTPDRHALRLVALYEPDAMLAPAAPDDALRPEHDRIAALLAAAGPAATLQAQDLFKRSLNAAQENKITVARRSLKTDYSPPKYDYMSGYLWIILMSCVGLLICLLFTRREAKGLITKRGREESDAEARAEEESRKKVQAGGQDRHEYYTPGYVPHKVFMLSCGLLLVTAALVEGFPALKLGLVGRTTQATAVDVVKERPGAEPLVLTTNAQIMDAQERIERSYVFWNRFQYLDEAGQLHRFRSPVGMQLKPAYNILDKEGLPTSVTIWYDPAKPDHVVLPLQISTWFVSGLLFIFGVITTAFACLLLYFARKPIALPYVKPANAPAPEKV